MKVSGAKIFFIQQLVRCLLFHRLLQDVSNTTIDVCDSSIVKKKMVVTWGQSLHLGCFLKLPAVLASQTVTWYHYSKEKGRYKIQYRPDKYVETSEHGLVIIAVTEQDAGRYIPYTFIINFLLIERINLTLSKKYLFLDMTAGWALLCYVPTMLLWMLIDAHHLQRVMTTKKYIRIGVMNLRNISLQ